MSNKNNNNNGNDGSVLDQLFGNSESGDQLSGRERFLNDLINQPVPSAIFDDHDHTRGGEDGAAGLYSQDHDLLKRERVDLSDYGPLKDDGPLEDDLTDRELVLSNQGPSTVLVREEPDQPGLVSLIEMPSADKDVSYEDSRTDPGIKWDSDKNHYLDLSKPTRPFSMDDSNGAAPTLGSITKYNRLFNYAAIVSVVAVSAYLANSLINKSEVSTPNAPSISTPNIIAENPSSTIEAKATFDSQSSATNQPVADDFSSGPLFDLNSPIQVSSTSALSDKNHDLIWVDEVDGNYVLRANISDSDFQSHGVGLGNLLAAIWKNPNLQLMDYEVAKETIIDSNLEGVRFQDPRFKQLQSCLNEQIDRKEIVNADPTKTTLGSTYQTHNLLIYDSVPGTEQTPPNLAQVSCKLDVDFVNHLRAKGGAYFDEEFYPNISNPLGGYGQRDQLIPSVPSSIDDLLPSESTSESDQISTSNLDLISDYSTLKNKLRSEDNHLINYSLIDESEKQATYDLVKKVANGQVTLSKTENDQLAIDAYNVLGDQKSDYFLSVSDIKKDLSVKFDLRSKSSNLAGVGRREQISERKNAFRDKLANLYQEHLAKNDGSINSFNQWKKQAVGLGATSRDLTLILSDLPLPNNLAYGSNHS